MLTAVLNDGTTVDTTYSGSKSIMFSGPGGVPIYPATVTFASGVGTRNITLIKAESTTITAADGSLTGVASSGLTVNADTNYGKLQLLMPAVTAASGTTTGKIGTPTAQTAGGAFSVTVNAVDANWNLINTVGDTVVTNIQ